MPSRTKEPRRKLTFKDVNGFDATLELSRQYNVTYCTWSAHNPDPMGRAPGWSNRTHVDYLPRAVLVHVESEVPCAVVAPESMQHVQLRAVWQAVGGRERLVVESRSVQLLNDASQGWYETRITPLSPATAQQVLIFINTFSEFFSSGAARTNRVEQKRTKLGGRRVKVTTLMTVLNPLYGPRRIEELDEGELVDVYVFPDSGTDTIELESTHRTRYGSQTPQSKLTRDPYFTSAQAFVSRYMYSSYDHAEAVGNGSEQLILVRPTGAVNERYQSGNGHQRVVGLYARTTDIYTLLHKIHNEQQQGWRVKGGVPDSSAIPNFPFDVTLEHVNWTTEEVLQTQEARVEYDGRDKAGQPRVKITPTPPYRSEFQKRAARNRGGVKPEVYTATLAQLQTGNELTNSDGFAISKNRVRIAKLDRERILVALDARYERGLKGLSGGEAQPVLGRVERRRVGNVIHLDNVMVRDLNGTLIPLPGFSDVCHPGGVRSVLPRLKEYLEAARFNLEAIASRPSAPVKRSFIDDEDDNVENERLRLQSVIDGLTRVRLELQGDMKNPDATLHTPVCFSSDRMTMEHEGTHAILQLEYPMARPNDPNAEQQMVVRNTIMKAAIDEFLHAVGPACAEFYETNGNELDPRFSHTEEVLTGLMGMVTSVRENNPALIKRTAWAFGTYLKQYTQFVDEVALARSMEAAARELIARYKDDDELMEDFLAFLDMKRQDTFQKGSLPQPVAVSAKKHMLDGVPDVVLSHEKSLGGLGAPPVMAPTALIKKKTRAFMLRFAEHTEYQQRDLYLNGVELHGRAHPLYLQKNPHVPGRVELEARGSYTADEGNYDGEILWSGNLEEATKLFRQLFTDSMPGSAEEAHERTLRLKTQRGEMVNMRFQMKDVGQWLAEASRPPRWTFDPKFDSDGLNLLLLREPEFTANEAGHGKEILQRSRAGEPMMIRADTYTNQDNLNDTTFWLLLNQKLYRLGRNDDAGSPTSFHAAWWRLLDTRPEFKQLVLAKNWKSPLMVAALDEILGDSQLPEHANDFKGIASALGMT